MIFQYLPLSHRIHYLALKSVHLKASTFVIEIIHPNLLGFFCTIGSCFTMYVNTPVKLSYPLM